MRQWKLSLLGPVRLTAPDGGRIIRLGAKMKALLAFLAVQPGGWAGRDCLARLLWDEGDEPDARHSLRQALFMLRQRLGDQTGNVLRSDHESIELCLETVEVDLRRFEQLVASPDNALHSEACGLWRGPFCEGLDVGSEAFEEWLQMQRIRLDELAAANFKQVAEMQLSAGFPGSAVSAAHHCVALNPYDDNAHATLIDLYRRLGRIGPARAAHRRCVALFQSELGVLPSRVVEDALTAPLGS